MDLSYEETMRRIAEYEKVFNDGRKYCKEKTFPWFIEVFKGEHHLFVVPSITTICGYSTWMAWYRKLDDTESPETIGGAILDALEHIRISPVDARSQAERDEDSVYLKETKCKSFRAFNKKFLCCDIRIDEQGLYMVSASLSSVDNRGYTGIDGDELVKLPSNATAADLGNAVINAFRIIEEYAKSQKPDPYPPVEVELLSDQKVKISPPRDRHFTDMQDGGAAEIYRLYEYYPKEAAELDCDMSEENIHRVWEEMYGSAEMFTIGESTYETFTLRVEMRNKAVHRISYLKQIDENELLECTMEVKQPNRRKKLDEQLSEMFETFAGKCAML